MKQMILVFCGLMIAGCTTTGNSKDTQAKIADLEKRVFELEKSKMIAEAKTKAMETRQKMQMSDLKIDMELANTETLLRSAGNFEMADRLHAARTGRKVTTNNIVSTPNRLLHRQPNFELTTNDVAVSTTTRLDTLRSRKGIKEREAESEKLRLVEEEKRKAKESKETEEQKKVSECIEKTKAFLKEYCGAEFGDAIQKFLPNDVNATEGTHKIPMIKKYWYFDTVEGRFLEGRLYSVVLSATFSNKYSQVSCDAQFDKASAQLWESLMVSNDGRCNWWDLENYRHKQFQLWWKFRPYQQKQTKMVGGYCFCDMKESDKRIYRVEFFNVGIYCEQQSLFENNRKKKRNATQSAKPRKIKNAPREMHCQNFNRASTLMLLTLKRKRMGTPKEGDFFGFDVG